MLIVCIWYVIRYTAATLNIRSHWAQWTEINLFQTREKPSLKFQITTIWMWSTFSSYSSENGNQWCQFSRSTRKNSSNRFHRARTAYKASKDDSLYARPPTLLLFLSRISICHSRWPCSLVKVTRAVTWWKNVGHDKIVSVRWESWSVSVYWLVFIMVFILFIAISCPFGQSHYPLCLQTPVH